MEEEPGIEERLRVGLRAVAAPVGVLLAHDGLEVRAATVTSFTSVTLHPPSMVVCVGHERRIFPLMEPGARCSINVLAAGQEDVADQFASRVRPSTGAPPVRLGRAGEGVPIVPRALAVFVCTVQELLPVGSHSLVVVHVDDVVLGGQDPEADISEPLLWHEGGYTYLQR
jgi:flavin reductase (DIM6/NTAB) family NADH-FMN oxidoreductase RutF